LLDTVDCFPLFPQRPRQFAQLGPGTAGPLLTCLANTTGGEEFQTIDPENLHKAHFSRASSGFFVASNFDVNAIKISLFGLLQQEFSDFGIMIDLATGIADFTRNVPNQDRGSVAFQHDAGGSRAGFAGFADDALHGFNLVVKSGVQCAGVGS
jgi:hypothetical protein